MDTKLELRLVGNISGDFFIADYQRGYRWKEEVEMLLNDISEVEEGKNYCLQPIVVKKVGDKSILSKINFFLPKKYRIHAVFTFD